MFQEKDNDTQTQKCTEFSNTEATKVAPTAAQLVKLFWELQQNVLFLLGPTLCFKDNCIVKLSRLSKGR